MIQIPAHNDRIFYLSLEFTDPEGTAWAMKNHLYSNLKLQRKVVSRDTLQKLLETGTNDVVSASKKLSNSIVNNKEAVHKKIIRFLMKLKLEDANSEVDKTKKEVQKTKLYLNKFMRDGTIVAAEYRETLENECRKNWEEKRRKMKNR